MANHYAIDSMHSNELCNGLSEHDRYLAAKNHANRLGEPVYLYQVGSDDAEEIEPDNADYILTPLSI